MELPTSYQLSQIKLIALDYTSGTGTIVAADGEIYTDSIESPRARSLVTRTTFFPGDSRVEVVAGSEKFSMILGTNTNKVLLPVIYLDQNHWIDFARWRKSPETFDQIKKPFFELLDQAVLENRVIVPLSSAHLVETSRRGGTSRIELAATMLYYSRGWQLRSVLGLRRAEIRSLFGGAPLAQGNVITLSPEAIFDVLLNGLRDEGFSIEIADLLQRLTWVSVLVDLLLSPEPIGNAGAQVAASWAESFAPLADGISGNAKAKARARELTLIRFFSDLGTDLPAAANEAGLTPEEFKTWLLERAEEEVAVIPGLGRLREVLHLRVSNADDKWEGNDLNDWMHLSYSAAYCDLVLGEKKTINYLKRATTQVPAGATLHRRASDAFVDLELLIQISRIHD